MQDVLVYAAQTAGLATTFDGDALDGNILDAESDSDWAVGHSTTGWIIFLAGAAIAYASKRQPCVAMSSTEAEIIAAITVATEIVYYRRLLAEMGLPQVEPTRLGVDNSGAVELSRDQKSCHRSRHVDRRFFKVRELYFEGELKVEKVDTTLNAADLLTKALEVDVMVRHARRAFGYGSESSRGG